MSTEDLDTSEADEDATADEVSSPEERARLLADAVVQSYTQEAKYRIPLAETKAHGRWKSPFAMVTFMLAGVIAVAPPSWLRPEPHATVTEGERVRGVRAALFLQAHQIEAYRTRNQRLPLSLYQLPTRVPGVRFVRSNDRVYQLVALAPDGSQVVYESTRPSDFDPVAAGWFTEVVP